VIRAPYYFKFILLSGSWCKSQWCICNGLFFFILSGAKIFSAKSFILDVLSL